MRPKNHSLWSVLVIIVAVFDLAGLVYVLYAPGFGAITLIGSVGPLVGLIGGIAGILWKPTEARVQSTAKT